MLATSARMVPDMASAWFELPSALNSSCSPSFFTSTFGSELRAIVPSGPFTEMFPPATFTSTPLGSGTGYFAIRDMAVSIRCGCAASSGDDAEDFAAHAVGAGLAVGHHAARGRQDRDAEPVHDARDVVAPLVHAQPGLRHALQALDHRAPGVVLEADVQLFLRRVVAQREVLDVALILQHLGNGGLQPRGGHNHLRVTHHLRVADAGQHVRDGIAHAHRSLLTSLP